MPGPDTKPQISVRRIAVALAIALLALFAFYRFGRAVWHPVLLWLTGTKTVAQRVDEIVVRHPELKALDARKVEILAIKDPGYLEVFLDGQFWKRFPLTALSGGPGPKLKEGDNQIPEGFYGITDLNPNSNYHLSLRLSYPNADDLARSEALGIRDPGGDIYIHGNEVSIGCLAIGDDAIEQLFYVVNRAGPGNASVVIAPSDLTQERPPVGANGGLYDRLKEKIARLRGSDPSPPPEKSPTVNAPLALTTQGPEGVPSLSDLEFEKNAKPFELTLPSEEARERLKIACPSCIEKGVYVCGDGNGHRPWKRFSKNMFTGNPRRSYFLVGAFLQDAFMHLVRTESDRERLLGRIRDRLTSMRLIAIEDGFAAFRDLGNPVLSKLTFPQALHSCLRDPQQPWVCSEGPHGKHTCCEKWLGFMEVTLEWSDPEKGERIQFQPTSQHTDFRVERYVGVEQVGLHYCYSRKRGIVQ